MFLKENNETITTEAVVNESETNSTPAAKVEPKPVTKPEVKVESKPESKVESKAEPKAESKAEPKAVSKAESKTEPKTDAKGLSGAEVSRSGRKIKKTKYASHFNESHHPTKLTLMFNCTLISMLKGTSMTNLKKCQ